MKLERVSAARRKRDGMGAAIAFVLQLDHMGAARGHKDATVYLGRSQLVDLDDAIHEGARLSQTESARLQEAIWDDIMTTVERLTGEYGDLTDTTPEEMTDEDQELVAWGEARGRAQGLAYALAVLRNPLAPDVEAVRAESIERWEAQMGDSAG